MNIKLNDEIYVKNIGVVLLLIAMSITAIVGLVSLPVIAQVENMTITSSNASVTVGVPQNIKFTVTSTCTPPDGGVCTQVVTPVGNASVVLSGVASGSSTTDETGVVIISVVASSPGDITATASKDGSTATTVIKAYADTQLNLTADTKIVYVSIQKNVTFTVTRMCGSDPKDKCSGNLSRMWPAKGVTVTLSGVASGSDVTDLDPESQTAKVTIPVNATAPGDITVTASKSGFKDATIIIPADYRSDAVFSFNKPVYDNGETVIFTLKNTGLVAIVPDMFWVKNISIFKPVIEYTLEDSSLEPGMSVNYTWRQTDKNNNQVTPWDYRAGISWSYHNSSNSNYTGTFKINPCGRTVYPARAINSTVGQDVVFSSDNFSETGKVWNVTWYINGTQDYRETGVTRVSNYTNRSGAIGVWNVTAIADSGCNTRTWTWKWTVTALPNCANIANDAPPINTYTGMSVKFSSRNMSDTHMLWNFIWYLNGTEVFNQPNVTQSEYINRSASIGVWNVTVVARSGCNKISWKWVWTVSTEPPKNDGGGSSGGSSGGGGGGGGGVTTSEPYENIVKFERLDADLKRGAAVAYTFTIPVLSIYQVLVTGKENEGGIGLRAEHLKDTSALVSRVPPGMVYANENLWIGSRRIDYVVLRFRVNNSWISENRINTANISLVRFDNGWKRLNSKVINTDSNYTYFESRSPGLSSFAVSAFKDDVQEAPTAPETFNPGTELGGNQTNETSTIKKSPGFGMVLGLGMILAMYLIVRMKRRRY